MYTAIIFDFFGVIGISTYQMVVEDISLNDTQKTALTDLHRAFDHGFMGEPEFMKEYASILQLPYVDFIERYYKAQEKFTASRAMLGLVEELKQTYKVGLLSNVGKESYEDFIKPIEGVFDAVVVSYSAFVAKPDVAAFEYIANELGVSPGDCIMIDDTYQNCEGARAAGMEAIVHTSYADTKQQLAHLLAN
jgi:HAD superfamily hydrolase (TIGR01509 family)